MAGTSNRPHNRSRVQTVVYSAHSFEKDAWERVLRETGLNEKLDVSFISARLEESTAPLCNQAQVVVLFAGDCVHKESVLRMLRQNGVELILLRYAGKTTVNYKVARALKMTVAQVSSTRTVVAVAEYVVALILNLHRQIIVLGARAKSGNTVRLPPRQQVLINRTIGLLGTDKVGYGVGRILKRIGCKVLAFDVVENGKVKKEGIQYVDTMEALLSQSDVVSLHIPPTDNTRHLINASKLALCRTGVHIINTGSLELIDLDALITAISTGQVGAFAADIFDGTTAHLFGGDPGAIARNRQLSRLKSLPNVILTAHQSTLTPEGLREIAFATLHLLKQLVL